MEDRIRYVYKVFDKLNEDNFYIGTTFDIEKRWKEHRKDSNSKKLNADMLEFGEQDFDIEILFSGTEDEADAEEIRLIAELKPYYNNPGDIGGKIGNGHTKLEEQDIIDICDRVVINNEKVSEVAKDYPQVSESYIYKIVNGDRWHQVKEAARRKATDNKGENSGSAILTNQGILDICNRIVVNGESVQNVAKDYSQISETYIYKIVNGDVWDHVKEAPRRKAGEVDNKGENNQQAKLTDQNIIDICDRVVVNNESVPNVAKDYPQVSERYIYKIINGDKRKDVVEAPRRKAKKQQKRFTKEEVLDIRTLAFEGIITEDIQKYIYTNKTVETIENVITGKSFSNFPGPKKGEDY